MTASLQIVNIKIGFERHTIVVLFYPFMNHKQQASKVTPGCGDNSKVARLLEK